MRHKNLSDLKHKGIPSFYYQLLSNVLINLVPLSEDYAPFSYICNRLLKNGRFSFNLKFLTTDCGAKLNFLPLTTQYVDSAIYKIINRLTEQNFIIHVPGSYPKLFFVNIPGLVRASLDILFMRKGIHNETVYKQMAKEVFEMFQEHGITTIPRITVTEGIKMKATESIVDGKNKNKKAVAKKQKDIEAKKVGVNPANIRFIMRQHCEELEREYFEPIWTNKEQGNCKMWINKYCMEDGIDPVKHIKKVVENWGLFRSGDITDKFGNPILLSPYPSFREYFTNRVKIDTWIFTREKEGSKPMVGRFANMTTIEVE